MNLKAAKKVFAISCYRVCFKIRTTFFDKIILKEPPQYFALFWVV